MAKNIHLALIQTTAHAFAIYFICRHSHVTSIQQMEQRNVISIEVPSPADRYL